MLLLLLSVSEELLEPLSVLLLEDDDVDELAPPVVAINSLIALPSKAATDGVSAEMELLMPLLEELREALLALLGLLLLLPVKDELTLDIVVAGVLLFEPMFESKLLESLLLTEDELSDVVVLS